MMRIGRGAAVDEARLSRHELAMILIAKSNGLPMSRDAMALVSPAASPILLHCVPRRGELELFGGGNRIALRVPPSAHENKGASVSIVHAHAATTKNTAAANPKRLSVLLGHGGASRESAGGSHAGGTLSRRSISDLIGVLRRHLSLPMDP